MFMLLMIWFVDCPAGGPEDFAILVGTDHSDFKMTKITHGLISVTVPVTIRLSVYMPSDGMPVTCSIEGESKETQMKFGYEDTEWKSRPRYCAKNGTISNPGEHILWISMTRGPYKKTREIRINATAGMIPNVL